MADAEYFLQGKQSASLHTRARFTWRISSGMGTPGILLGLIFVSCFALPLIYPLPEPVGGSVLEANLPLFSPGHWLGTDANGNDLLSRLIHGGRMSLLIALGANLLGFMLGATLGTFSAYAGGIVDALLMRLLDTFIAFPSLVLVLIVAHGLGPGALSTIVALLFFSVPAFARLARAATLSLCSASFVPAAVLAGTPGWKILLCHIGPNIAPQLLAFSLLGMGIAIVTEGALSFLGLGIQAPAPSWGGMIFQGQQALTSNPLLVLLPGLALFITVLVFNLLGEVLRARWGRT